jgi:hypothetical protein
MSSKETAINAEHNGKEPAMPIVAHNEYGIVNSQTSSGLSKREHFAAMAMQGLLVVDGYVKSEHMQRSAKELGKAAVAYADGLLLALEESR